MKVRVLHIIPDFRTGGAERLVVNLLSRFDPDRFEVAGVSLYPPRDTILEKEIGEKCLKVFFLNKRLGLDLGIVPQILQVLREFRPDVVHTHLHVLPYPLPAVILSKVPVRIHTVHNIAQKEVNKPKSLTHHLAFRLGGFLPVSVSHFVADTVRAVYGIDTPVIYNGVPTGDFTPATILKPELSRNPKILVNIARLVPQKNQLLLIEAFSLVIKEYPNAILWLVGEGSLRPLLEERVKQLGLQEKVFFLGIRTDIPKILAEAGLFVLSSDWEGLPLTVLEAMASGKPVVATKAGGIPEAVENRVTGILVPPKDAKALAQAILELLTDSDLCLRLGEAGQKRVRNCFDIKKTVKEYESLYLKLLSAKKGAKHI